MDTRRSSGSDGGVLDEALERLHRSGPERNDWLSNHAPMAVEALARHGQASAVHRWVDRYRDKLEDLPAESDPITDDGWREALGDPRRLGDWTAYFTRVLESDGRPWRQVLAEWWPRLLPGISGAATHPVIRAGHAVRALLDGELAPRRTELAHALGYWAARHHELRGIEPLPAPDSAASGLAAVPRVGDQSGSIRDRLARISALPAPVSADGPEQARARLTELVRASTHRYGTHAHGDPVMLVHAATAPNAVLRTLPALPERLWQPSLEAAWAASTAVTAAYAPAAAVAAPAVDADADEVFARAAAHGDEHVIKFADTALDVVAREVAARDVAVRAQDAASEDVRIEEVRAEEVRAEDAAEPALAAALRGIALNEPPAWAG